MQPIIDEIKKQEEEKKVYEVNKAAEAKKRIDAEIESKKKVGNEGSTPPQVRIFGFCE
jgi:hypothetical protein